MPFTNANIESGLSLLDKFQVGRSNVDGGGTNVEQGLALPWADKESSWVYYECAVKVMLDSGIVVHNRLPQFDKAADTLASSLLDDPKLASQIGEVNLKSNDQFKDIVQRMGHSRYWFHLVGKAMRIGYKIPIPSIKTVGGVPAVPYDRKPQFAYNKPVPGGGFGGIPLWMAFWSLWYTTSVPPTSNKIPMADPSGHLDLTKQPPDVMQVPTTRPDDNAVLSNPARPTRRRPSLGNTPNVASQ